MQDLVVGKELATSKYHGILHIKELLKGKKFLTIIEFVISKYFIIGKKLVSGKKLVTAIELSLTKVGSLTRSL